MNADQIGKFLHHVAQNFPPAAFKEFAVTYLDHYYNNDEIRASLPRGVIVEIEEWGKQRLDILRPRLGPAMLGGLREVCATMEKLCRHPNAAGSAYSFVGMLRTKADEAKEPDVKTFLEDEYRKFLIIAAQNDKINGSDLYTMHGENMHAVEEVALAVILNPAFPDSVVLNFLKRNCSPNLLNIVLTQAERFSGKFFTTIRRECDLVPAQRVKLEGIIEQKAASAG